MWQSKQLLFHLLLYEVIKLYQPRTSSVSRFLVHLELYFLKYKKMQTHLLVYVYIRTKFLPDNPVQQDLTVAAERNAYQYFILQHTSKILRTK